MSQTAGLTTLSEDDIETHRATAHQMVTRIVVVSSDDGASKTALGGTGRRARLGFASC